MPLSPSMAAFPQFYSNYTTFPSDFPEFTTQASSAIDGNKVNNNFSVIDNRMCGHQDSFNHNVPNNGTALGHVPPVLECDTMMASSLFPTTFSDQLGSLSELAIPVIYGGADGGFQSLNLNGGGYKPSHHLGDFGDECCGFVEDIMKPPSYPNSATEKWGSYQGNQITAVEEPNIKVGRYSEEERKERILRYLKKRNQRNFNKTIKYACRKTLADRRVRVRGRFARNNDLCEDEIAMKKNENITHKHDLYGGHHDSIQFQLKNDEEEDDWLQEAMASLVYLSHSSPEDI
ncbi:hypothetical protein QN277_010154 [Acacia crassicarpa]|uniref:CCT domain-containing protein n=1 Tax=Acacia crassicarpa TaxID=499986 RepID=A0AAE1JL59_9FABA|nr:hypothetical protein QN277_010154 [Acacia crassicarpa]